ncbi:hypothetical protein FRB91_007892 [Serendipita sp. 411]|nr:hypothetical protein FRC19_008291 [Serendipita sp. 401]KAG8851443.1 hypothetical protein FRB91_007892 [Serendipita sp. 411]KAG9053612.1 hypothetical protein FS842_007696 [Serendipita sp. 407]
MLSDTTTTTVTSLSLPLSGSPAHKPVIYSPNDLLQLAPSPFSSSSASSSSSSAASSNQPSPFSLTFSLPSSLQLPSSISQQMLLSRLQNFPDILAPSAAEALAAATATNPSGTDTATTGNDSGSLSLFDVPVDDDDDDEEERSDKDGDSEDGDGEEEDEEEEEEEEEEDGFVYGESRFNKRDDLGFHEVEMLKKAVRYALVGGRGRRTAVVWQAQTPRTPSRAASPVRKVEMPAIAAAAEVDGKEAKESAVADGTTVALAVGKPTNRPFIVHTNPSSQPPVLVTRPSNSRCNSRSRSRSGTLSLFSHGERGGGGNGGGGGGGGTTNPARQGMGVWRSRTLMARMANQQQQYQQQYQQHNQRRQQQLQTIRSGSVLVEAKKTSVNAAGAGARAEEATSWRRLERGSEWRWNERSGSYVVVKV